MYINNKYKISSAVVLFCMICNISCKTTKAYKSAVSNTITFTMDTASLNLIDTTFNPYRMFNVYYETDGVNTSYFALGDVRDSAMITTADPVCFYQDNLIANYYTAYPGDNILVKTDSTSNLLYLAKNNIDRNNEFYANHLLNNKFSIIKNTVLAANWYADTLHFSNEAEAKDNLLRCANIAAKQERIALDSLSKIYILSAAFVKDKVCGIQADSLYTISLFSEKYTRRFHELNSLENIYRNLCRSADSLTLNENRIAVSFTVFLNFLLQRIVTLQATSTLHLFSFDELDKRFSLITEYFTGQPRYYLLSQAMHEAIKSEINIPDSFVERYNTLCKDGAYKQHIAQELKRIGKSNGNATDNVKDDLENRQSVKELIQSRKGKLILIDFWASWCAPCRQEIPYSYKLRKLYKNKPVAFIYISLDRNESSWIKACHDEQFDNGNSFLMLSNINAPLVKKHKIDSIPRYMLIGKDGKIISADAPRPSDKALLELIEKNL